MLWLRRNELQMVVRIGRVRSPMDLALTKLRRRRRRLGLDQSELDRGVAMEQDEILGRGRDVLQHLANRQASPATGLRAPERRATSAVPSARPGSPPGVARSARRPRRRRCRGVATATAEPGARERAPRRVARREDGAVELAVREKVDHVLDRLAVEPGGGDVVVGRAQVMRPNRSEVRRRRRRVPAARENSNHHMPVRRRIVRAP